MNINNEKRNIKAIALVSGGLDSLIAALLIKLQGIEVIGLNFRSPFCLCDKAYRNAECGLNLYYQKLDIKLYFLEKGDDYLEIIKNPKYGYGKNLNPCIDCRIYILNKAKEFAKQVKADIICTGEVLDQRPKSQNLRALKIIEKETNLEGKLLRPLSARLLEPTIYEKEGIIDRNKLLAIRGRSRKKQLEIARKYGLLNEYYACGGCLLTDKAFANRLRDYFKYNKNISMASVRILKYGRHFRYKNSKIIVGRNQLENNLLLTLKTPQDIIIKPKDVVGPITIVQGDLNEEILDFAAKLTLRYSDLEDSEGSVKFGQNENNLKTLSKINIKNFSDYYKYLL
ncbi:MAG: tRNA 4-thiouridine(8) synthase ThiI [Promethearchaeia archaeon]